MKHDSVLEVRDVSVRFGGLTALDAVSLTVEPRQVLGVIGPNGAGKTTLLNVLCGFIRPDEGQVLLDGRRYDLRPHRLAGLPRSGRDERRLRQEAVEALDRVGAGSAAGVRPGELPYGMRKRVALARALAARPKLLL